MNGGGEFSCDGVNVVGHGLHGLREEGEELIQTNSGEGAKVCREVRLGGDGRCEHDGRSFPCDPSNP